ncbi:MAG: hypothetical protein WHT09_00500 [Thermogutta sp.]
MADPPLADQLAPIVAGKSGIRSKVRKSVNYLAFYRRGSSFITDARKPGTAGEFRFVTGHQV